MAASYLSKRDNNLEWVVLLGTYSTADLSETELSVLLIYGNEDRGMNREKYEEGKGNGG